MYQELYTNISKLSETTCGSIYHYLHFPDEEMKVWTILDEVTASQPWLHIRIIWQPLKNIGTQVPDSEFWFQCNPHTKAIKFKSHLKKQINKSLGVGTENQYLLWSSHVILNYSHHWETFTTRNKLSNLPQIIRVGSGGVEMWTQHWEIPLCEHYFWPDL